MSTTPTPEGREAFEASSFCFDPARQADGYKSLETHRNWTIWKAALSSSARDQEGVSASSLIDRYTKAFAAWRCDGGPFGEVEAAEKALRAALAGQAKSAAPVEALIEAIDAEIDSWAQVPKHLHGAMKRRLANIVRATRPEAPPSKCTTIDDCTTPKLCLSVGTCKGYYVMPASVRESATPPAAIPRAAPVEPDWTTKQRFDELVGTLSDPVERLRFFCSLAMSGQDWLDVEPLFDALANLPAIPEAPKGPSFSLIRALVQEKNKLHAALELACGYLTDEQAHEIAQAMPDEAGIPEAPAQTEAARLAIEALEAAKNGLEWYRRECEDCVDGSDDEMDAQIDAAIAALATPSHQHTSPQPSEATWLPSMRDQNLQQPRAGDVGGMPNGEWYQHGYSWGWNDCLRRIQEERTARLPGDDDTGADHG